MERIWPEQLQMEYEKGNLRKNSFLRLYYGDHLKLDTGVKGVLSKKSVKSLMRNKLLKNMLVVLINDRGQFVCIPTTNDEPTIGIMGMRRVGKTLMFINLLGAAYHNCGKMCGIIADQTGETGTWGKGNETKIFLQKLKILGQSPVGIPIVQLFPNIEGSIVPNPKYAPVIPISYAFDKFIKHPEKLLDFEGSTPYFDSFKEKIEKFKDERGNKISIEELLGLIEQSTVRKKSKNEEVIEKGGLPPGTSNKLKNIFNALWRKKIFDVTCDYPSHFELRIRNSSYKLEPFSACVAAKLIPSLLISQLQREPHYKNYFESFLEDIYDQQTRPGNIFYDKQLKIWLFVDEMNNIPKGEALNLIMRTGGPARIGVVWSTQEPSSLDQTIVKQTKYFIIYKLNTTDLKAIEKSCSLTKAQMSRIKNQEKFQCCLVSQEPVYIYDPRTNTVKKDTVTENPQFGGMVFPVSQPKIPADEEGVQGL